MAMAHSLRDLRRGPAPSAALRKSDYPRSAVPVFSPPVPWAVPVGTSRVSARLCVFSATHNQAAGEHPNHGLRLRLRLIGRSLDSTRSTRTRSGLGRCPSEGAHIHVSRSALPALSAQGYLVFVQADRRRRRPGLNMLTLPTSSL